MIGEIVRLFASGCGNYYDIARLNFLAWMWLGFRVSFSVAKGRCQTTDEHSLSGRRCHHQDGPTVTPQKFEVPRLFCQRGWYRVSKNQLRIPRLLSNGLSI